MSLGGGPGNSVTSAVRHRALAVIGRLLPAHDALDLEHACYCAALVNGSSYRRLVFTALHGLEHGALAGIVVARGGAAAVAASVEAVYGTSPAREDVRSREDAAQRARAMLKDLAHAEHLEIPNAGIRCRCGSNEVTFDFLQTRSADEGTTVFCTCICGKRWKM